MKIHIKIVLIVLLVLSLTSFAQSKEKIVDKDSLNFYLDKLEGKVEKVSISKIKSMKVSYIYLDGSKLSVDKINTLRRTIIANFKSGIPFSELANKYTMDGLKDGDLDWFNEGIMVKVFEDEIKNHKKGDIFIVNIPKRKWYYVVYKTQDDREKIKLTYIEKEE